MTDEKPLQPEELGDLYVLYLRASPEQRAAIRGTEAGLLAVDRSKACPLDPKCYRYQGHDGEHMYARLADSEPS